VQEAGKIKKRGEKKKRNARTGGKGVLLWRIVENFKLDNDSDQREGFAWVLGGSEKRK